MIIPNIWKNKKCSKPPTRIDSQYIKYYIWTKSKTVVPRVSSILIHPPRTNIDGMSITHLNHWDFQDPKMEVLYHIRPYFLVILPYIGLRQAFCMLGTSNLGSYKCHWIKVSLIGQASSYIYEVVYPEVCNCRFRKHMVTTSIYLPNLPQTQQIVELFEPIQLSYISYKSI